MVIRNFRTAAQGLGKFCPIKNELRVRKGRKTYRFTCGEQELRLASTGQPELVLPLASDAKVYEFRKFIVLLIENNQTPSERQQYHLGRLGDSFRTGP